jgi:hypothetical protein
MLYQYAEKYEMLYKQPKKDILTVSAGCVIAQQVSFNIGRNIRNLTEKRIKLLK